MKIAVYTPMTAFQNDIGDVVRLFYGEGAAVEPPKKWRTRSLIHAHERIRRGIWCETFVLTSMETGTAEQEYTECADCFMRRLGGKASA